MHKTKTSRKRASSFRNIKAKKGFFINKMKPISLRTKKGISPFDPNIILKNEKLIVQALLESFIENDPEAVIEIMDGYLSTVNKKEFAEKTGIARSTIYDMLHGKKNPTLRVFMHCVHHILSQTHHT